MKTVNKILSVLNFKQKIGLIKQFVFIIIGTMLELASIGMLFPIISILTNPNNIEKSNILIYLNKIFGLHDFKISLYIIFAFLISIFFLKMIFVGFLTWSQNNYVYTLQSFLSKKIYTGYLNQKYIYQIQRNSSFVINNVTLVVQQFTASLIAILYILTESLNLIGIITFLIILEPIGTLTTFCTLSISAFFFYQITKKRVISWGKSLNYHEELSLKYLQEGVGGLKELKLFRVEEHFSNKYVYHDKQRSKIRGNYITIQAFPRLWLEFLAVTGLFILLVLLLQGNNYENVLPKIGIFAIASFKLIPSFNKILNSIQNVKYTKGPLDVIVSELQSLNYDNLNDKNIELNFNNHIQIQNVNFSYPGTNNFALNNINFNINKGQSVGLIGTTGSGKSTLLDLILGLLTPTNGFVKVDDNDINENPRNWQSRIGYVPQFIYLVDGTLRNNIAFGIPDNEINDNKILRALKLSNLEEFVNNMPLKLHTQVGERGIALSGGQRQRVGIARALYNDPEILVLDEATSSLDIETEKNVMESIRLMHGNKTIIIIAHRYSTILTCDIVYKIEKGVITDFGKPNEVIKKIN